MEMVPLQPWILPRSQTAYAVAAIETVAMRAAVAPMIKFCIVGCRCAAAISRRGFPSTQWNAATKTAVAILGEAGTRIGTHLADLVNLFDPEIIVVGGEAVQFGDALLTPLRNTMELYLFFSRPELLTDRVPSSWARGVAALATQSIFDFECSPSGSRDKHGCAVAMCLDWVDGSGTRDPVNDAWTLAISMSSRTEDEATWLDCQPSVRYLCEVFSAIQKNSGL